MGCPVAYQVTPVEGALLLRVIRLSFALDILSVFKFYKNWIYCYLRVAGVHFGEFSHGLHVVLNWSLSGP
jgi:hypothetical protein